MAKRKARNSFRAKGAVQQAADDSLVPQVSQGNIDTQLQEHIGRQLQALYDEVLQEPVPDRFLKLLTDLENKRGQGQ